MKRKKRAKWMFIKGCAALLVVLGIVRYCCPGVMEHHLDAVDSLSAEAEAMISDVNDSEGESSATEAVDRSDQATILKRVPCLSAMADNTKHKVLSVSDFEACFPDSQALQVESAKKLGLKHVPHDREEALGMKRSVYYAGASPYYVVDSRMKQSIPYLVPQANVLLQRIGRNFLDSLAVKDIPLHRIMVSSIWRTEDDVRELQKDNRNATSHSCHLYATTFDIGYNNYVAYQPSKGPRRTYERTDLLKCVLAEVLRDLRDEGACYVKYEVRQPCFHITVR